MRRLFLGDETRVEVGDGVRRDNRVLYADLYSLDSVKRLWWAYERGYSRMVAFIVSHRVGLHAENENAFRAATERGRIEVVQYLVEQGADLHTENEAGLFA